MKKSRIFSALLVLALLSTCVIGGTFAKYTSTATGTATATVAKWSFKVGTKEIANATPQTVTFNLFETIKEADTTTSESDVAPEKIAPGTGGSFAISVQNTSEVTAQYSLAFTGTNNNSIPIEFSLDKTDWYADISSMNITASDATKLNIGSDAKDVNVYWRWAFIGTESANFTTTQTDETDTLLGIYAQNAAATPTYVVNATITATQVD